MRTNVLLLAIALLITIPVTTAAQDPNKRLVPLRFMNEAVGPLTVKLVGPTHKTLRLAYNENLVVLVNPGEFQCFYRFKGGPRDPFIFKKTEKFQVPLPAWDKPNDGLEVQFAEADRARGGLQRSVQDIVPSSLKEFSAADASALQPAEIDNLSFSNLDVVLVIGSLIYGNGPDDTEDRRNEVLALFNQYFRSVLFPRLGRLGIHARYLGVRAFDENTLITPALVIHYNEEKGKQYAWGASATPEWGVLIDCSLALNLPGIFKGRGIWGATLHEENDESLKGNILANPQELLHKQALSYLRTELNDLEFDLADWGPKSARRADRE